MSAQKTTPGGALAAFLGLIGFSVVAGVLVTAMVTPALAVASTTANNTVGIFEDLPDYLDFGQLSQRNTLWATQGGQPVAFAQVFDQNREEVTWDNVSQFAKDAAVAGEDERFYTHGGVDMAGIARAALNNVTSSSTQGASTLTQQLVKNLLIADALNESDPDVRSQKIAEAQANSLDRKLKEAKLAIGLEKRYTKQEILLGYLNIAGYGGNTYGIESAAQQYYSTSAKDLTLAQAASLVAIVQSPNTRKPDSPDNWAANQSRRDAILGNMLTQKLVDQAQYDEAIATPVNETTVHVSVPQQGCQNATAAAHFCSYVVNNIDKLEALGANAEERRANWKIGGYDIYTSIDLDQQSLAEQTLARYTPANETRFQLGSAISTIQVGTGRIVVMAQNKGFNSTDTADATQTSVNFNTDASNGSSTGFQPGSTYKLFTLVNWLQNGHGLNEFVDGSPRTYSLPAKCSDVVPNLFRNDGNTNFGRINVLRATAQSVNAAFANMASQLDLCDIRDTAVSMGMHRADGGELKTNPTMILGTDEVAPLSVANAYATVASGGILCQPIAVDKVVDASGAELVGQSQDCSQAITPDVAAAAATALQGVMNGGTGNAANPRDGTPLIGKTGTADAVHTFLAAASTRLATAAWIGNIVGTQDLRRITVGGVNGGRLRFPIMREVLTSLDASALGADAAAFPTASRALLTGTTQAVPNVAGQSPDNARVLIESLGLSYSLGGTVASELPAGQVASTDPGAGSLVSRGSQITVSTSDGTLSTTVPNVVGESQADAVRALNAAGFDAARYTYTYVESSPENVCDVTSVSPAAGGTAAKSAAITLTVNGGVLGAAAPRCT
ncbi:MAG: transglycosylase domain-containing protein [Burkholderiaceae bacterium]|nr:transglycosylase domain-containing protein [Microbacteriaceae bacterium]